MLAVEQGKDERKSGGKEKGFIGEIQRVLKAK
jgi:hypothetical protein